MSKILLLCSGLKHTSEYVQPFLKRLEVYMGSKCDCLDVRNAVTFDERTIFEYDQVIFIFTTTMNSIPSSTLEIFYKLESQVKKGTEIYAVIGCDANDNLQVGDVVLVDYYVEKQNGYQFEIAANSFSGNFYIEGETLYRRESDGMDMPAEFIIPNGKVQSNFNIAMSNSGDPSTFTFTVDCFPAYPKFLVEGEERKKVLALLQITTDNVSGADGEIEYRLPCDGTLPEG